MKKRLISLLLLVCLAFTAAMSFVGCGLFGGESSEEIEKIDYVAQTNLDMSSSSAKLELSAVNAKAEKAYTHIDGDTTHFEVPYSFDKSGKFKARYLAVDTPESTGTIEVWGKKASNFTKEKLASATSIVLEGQTAEWTQDTNQRYLAWIWYRTADDAPYRNLNLELLQEGLAVNSSIEGGSPYEDVCSKAYNQAKALKLYVHSTDTDPDFYYGQAIQTNLKEVRTNLAEYSGKRVVLYATVTAYKSKGSIYVEYYDEEDDRTYGLPIFYGLDKPTYDPLLAVGNEVRISGEISYSDTYGYQMASLTYEIMNPSNPENIQVISSGNSPIYMETTAEAFIKDNYAYAKSYQYSSVSIKDLYVYDVYTTTTEDSKNKGAMTLYCRDAIGCLITVRTGVFKDAQGNLITEDYYLNKTIDARGIVDTFDGTYQINSYSMSNIDVKPAN